MADEPRVELLAAAAGQGGEGFSWLLLLVIPAATTPPDAIADLLAPLADRELAGLGLCQRRWEAKLAGQLKTLSHSGQRYST